MSSYKGIYETKLIFDDHHITSERLFPFREIHKRWLFQYNFVKQQFLQVQVIRKPSNKVLLIFDDIDGLVKMVNDCSISIANTLDIRQSCTKPSTWHDMMTSSNGNIFCVTGPLRGEFIGPGEFPAQRPVTRSFDVFFDWRLNIYGWVNNREAGVLRRHRPHYNVIVITCDVVDLHSILGEHSARFHLQIMPAGSQFR